MKQFFTVLLIAMMIPYITTLAWTGQVEVIKEGSNSGGLEQTVWSSNSEEEETYRERTVVIEREEKEVPVSLEEYLVHVLAAQIPIDFELETLKAQAVLARTYICGLMEGRTMIYEEELDMDARSTEEMNSIWGEKAYLTNRLKLQTAVEETDGLYLLYEGALIEPLFCYASAGKTRSLGDDYPFFKQVESPGDLQAENYRSMPVFKISEFAKKISEIPGSVGVSEKELADGGGIQIVERDGAGYVKQVLIGQKTYTGEEVQYALGLASPCYSFERLDGKIRVICKGIGHGYGFSQFGANEMAKEGATYQELLQHYFQNVEIVGRE